MSTIPKFDIITRVVVDTDSVSEAKPSAGEAWELFQQVFGILADRDYQLVFLTSDNGPFLSWTHRKEMIVLEGTRESFQQQEKGMEKLLGQTTVWVTDDPQWHAFLTEKQQPFTQAKHDCFPDVGVEDLLRVLNPNAHTSFELRQQIFQRKRDSVDTPYVVGIGGPDDCGHEFIVSCLIDSMEDAEFVIQGVDLRPLQGLEFLKKGSYWRDKGIQDWVTRELLEPFVMAQRVLVETPPTAVAPYDVTGFPLFLAPQMILVLWGTTLFTEELQEFIDYSILLELSPKAAAARAFGLDDREDFEPSFIEQYQQRDGKLYQEYLKEHQVMDHVEARINYDNFHAFRFAAES